jgi:hypothetical protein
MDLNFQNLKTLVLSGFVRQDLDFVRRHQGHLTMLFLSTQTLPRRIQDEPESDEMWSVLASCSALHTLTLVGIQISAKNWLLFWSVWSRLSCLRLYQVSLLELILQSAQRTSQRYMDGWSPLNLEKGEALPMTTIKELTLSQTYASKEVHSLELLKWCPELKSLGWFPVWGYDGAKIGMQLAEYSQHCPKLVNVMVSPDSKVDDALFPFLEFRSRNNNFDPLKELTFNQKWIGEPSWTLLREQYSSTLQTLKLDHAFDIKGSTIQDMLCSLPNLMTFSGRLIQESDILNDPRPWACLGISQLRIGIELSGDLPGTNRMFLERLGTLKRLRHLELLDRNYTNGPDYTYGPDYTRATNRCLSFRLDNGLDSLVALRRLEVLDIKNASQKLTIGDVLWMLESWPQLKGLYCTVLHADQTMSSSLRKMLDAHHIEAWHKKKEEVHLTPEE